MGFFSRIGNKTLGFARRVGTKISSVASPVLRMGAKIGSNVAEIAGKASKVLSYATPILEGMGFGKLAKLTGKAKTISNRAGKAGEIVGVASRSGQNVIRSTNQILQDPSTTMTNVRRIKADIGGSKKSIEKAYREAKNMGY